MNNKIFFIFYFYFYINVHIHLFFFFFFLFLFVGKSWGVLYLLRLVMMNGEGCARTHGPLDKPPTVYTRKIIVYFRNTINACSLLSHEWWIPLIKFMVKPTIHVRGGSTHLWYSGST